MVQTKSDLGIFDRVTGFFVFLWGLIYLFFASILSNPKANTFESQNKARFGGGKGGKMMKGLSRGGKAFPGGG